MSDLDRTPDQEIRESDSAAAAPVEQEISKIENAAAVSAEEAQPEPALPTDAPAPASAAAPPSQPETPPDITDAPNPPMQTAAPLRFEEGSGARSAPAQPSVSQQGALSHENGSPLRSGEGPGVRSQTAGDFVVEEQIRRMSRRSFLTGALGIAAGYFGWRWLIGQPDDNGIPRPFRHALEFDEGLARAYFQGYRLTPTFPKAQATEPRANGDEGLPDDFDPDTWKLQVAGLASGSAALTLDAIKALPRVEMVTELKCIEGWSTVVHWAGARFADFVAKYPPAASSNGRLPEYVALETPDGGYYVGLDMASAMHPQTLLCYEMNGAPLTAEHGAPLRLAIPVKYGIKNIKRIGVIRYTSERPKDYWAERGYDWYAGH